MPTTTRKTFEQSVEVEITDHDVYRRLMDKALSRIGNPDTAGVDLMAIGPHVFGNGESRWHLGTDETAALLIRAAYRVLGSRTEQEISGWALLDDAENPPGEGMLKTYDTRDEAIQKSDDAGIDLDVVALDLNGDPIIRD